MSRILIRKNGNENGILYIVGLPLGNKEDITIRAINVLKEADIIAAEDTRETGRFLSFYNIKTPIISYHEYNEKSRCPLIIKKLQSGESIALVSDAGTPCISDPGYFVVKQAVENGIQVSPVPGPCAAITALCASGLPTDSFVFIGFLPKKEAKRAKILQELAKEEKTIIFYESPKRVLDFLRQVMNILGDRQCVLCREMTKKYEEFLRTSISEIIEILERKNTLKGECVLLIRGFERNNEDLSDIIKQEIRILLKEKDAKASDIARKIAVKYGVSRNVVYKEVLARN